MGNGGKAGCGCLIGILVVVMVLAGLTMHPMSLRFLMKQLRYEDRIVPADAVFVPRFTEDRKGDLYAEAFREYFAGNGKAIYIEDEMLLGASVAGSVSRMARARGVKDNVIRGIDPGPDEAAAAKAKVLKEKLRASGMKKVIVVVPDYASRRYHYIYSSSGGPNGVFYMIRPVQVPYFQRDRWWRDSLSRSIMAREIYASLSYYSSLLRKEEGGK